MDKHQTVDLWPHHLFREVPMLHIPIWPELACNHRLSVSLFLPLLKNVLLDWIIGLGLGLGL